MMTVTRLGRLVLTSTWRHPVLTVSCRGARMSAHQLKTENKKFSAEGNKILKSPLCKVRDLKLGLGHTDTSCMRLNENKPSLHFSLPLPLSMLYGIANCTV